MLDAKHYSKVMIFLFCSKSKLKKKLKQLEPNVENSNKEMLLPFAFHHYKSTSWPRFFKNDQDVDNMKYILSIFLLSFLHYKYSQSYSSIDNLMSFIFILLPSYLLILLH